MSALRYFTSSQTEARDSVRAHISIHLVGDAVTQQQNTWQRKMCRIKMRNECSRGVSAAPDKVL